METTVESTTPTVVTDAMVAALSVAVGTVVADIATSTSQSFSATVKHVAEVWEKVSPIYTIYNDRWLASAKNVKKVAMSTAKFFEHLEAQGWVMPAQMTPAMIMATRHDNDEARKAYVAESTTTFVSIPGYFTYLIGLDRKARTAANGSALTDDQKRDLATVLLGNGGAGYDFTSFWAEGSGDLVKVNTLLELISDATVQLANLQTAMGDKAYKDAVKLFNENKAAKAGIVKA